MRSRPDILLISRCGRQRRFVNWYCKEMRLCFHVGAETNPAWGRATAGRPNARDRQVCPLLQRLFRRARRWIGRGQFARFRRVVVAIAGMNGLRSLVRVEKLCKDRRTRQAIAYFLTWA